MQKIEDKETKLYKAFQNGVREGKLEERERIVEIINKSNLINIGQKNNLKAHIKKQLQKEISSEEGK